MSTIFFLLFLLSFTSSVLSTKDDEIVLLKIKKQLGDPDILQSWVKGFNFCDFITSTSLGYASIGCTNTGRVSIIVMEMSSIVAPFPDAVCGLTELENFIIFNMMGLYGPIPSCITKLYNLHQLIIIKTSLSGSVPSFYNHVNITEINLSVNHLSGTIPSSLSTLPNLKTLVLSSNYLTGTIPPGLVHGSFPTLVLSNNNLTGELPKCYGWVDFSVINLSNNRLSGDASFLFGEQKKTADIVLAYNDFEFDLSHVEFSDNLHALDLSHNNIFGKVPESFATADGLYSSNLSFNKLCGELPQGGNMCRFDASVFANNTCLFGNPPSPCFMSIALAPAPAPVPVSEPPF
ncbi:Polygalacturonase inhibitor 2 [Carex littledalei]|uniref:Polygalacturonase inhibitor 2 n=1 Tax=Carex littledalei TaxID=544730 RepID=A0A833R261_9POAL|nr:Polygalacturonase inhibitor 2 [Carex littledalei]